jgi:hypothetical protein
MPEIQKQQPKCASASGFANETGRDGRRRETPATLTEPLRLVSETRRNTGDGETRVVVLITHRRP